MCDRGVNGGHRHCATTSFCEFSVNAIHAEYSLPGLGSIGETGRLRWKKTRTSAIVSSSLRYSLCLAYPHQGASLPDLPAAGVTVHHGRDAHGELARRTRG